MESKPVVIQGSIASVTPVAADAPAEKRKVWPMVVLSVVFVVAIIMTLRKGHAKSIRHSK